MAHEQPGEVLPEDRRKEIFLALVEFQDAGKSVSESRAETGRRFALTDAQVRAIESEGLENEWPPL
jgi:hypothetical protein